MTGSHGEAQDPLFVKVWFRRVRIVHAASSLVLTRFAVPPQVLGAHFAVVLLLIALILDPPSTGADAIVGISANQSALLMSCCGVLGSCIVRALTRSVTASWDLRAGCACSRPLLHVLQVSAMLVYVLSYSVMHY